MKYSNSKTNLRKYIAEHEAEYYNVSRESCELISVLTDSKELRELEHCDDGMGGVNMCQALLEIKEEGREEGICALICDYMEEGFSKDKILSKLQNRFFVSEEKAEYYFEKYSAKQ